NVVPILAFSDAFLLPSDGESFGLAALEAMACGIPVVGARAGGLPEVVEDGVSGILEPLGATERMGERLVQVLGNRNAARAMGEAARERAVSCFAADQIVPKYEELYARALSGGTR
ncbi:MAG TPA: glycosyltransferase, partial [Planctomycetota bacterium]|nr:glycosyltransferase [Planctomycetota bacterium]